MTATGWAFMLISCGFVIGLTAYCYYKVFTTPCETDRLHAPIEIDTKDLET